MVTIEVENRIWVTKNGRAFLGQGRIELLEAVQQHGSISRAALEMGMSYKKAWQLIKSMNVLSEKPLVIKEVGGKKGGGTILTKSGKEIITTFRQLEKRNKEFLVKESQNLKLP